MWECESWEFGSEGECEVGSIGHGVLERLRSAAAFGRVLLVDQFAFCYRMKHQDEDVNNSLIEIKPQPHLARRSPEGNRNRRMRP